MKITVEVLEGGAGGADEEGRSAVLSHRDAADQYSRV